MDYKYITRDRGRPVLLNLEGETVDLSNILVDMFLDEEEDNFNLTKSEIAEEYSLNERQVGEALEYFVDCEDFLTDFDIFGSHDTAFGEVNKKFYELSAEYDDVEKEVLDDPGDADLAYRLYVDGNTLEADIKQDHAYLRDDHIGATLKVEKESIGDKIQEMYNGMRMRNE